MEIEKLCLGCMKEKDDAHSVCKHCGFDRDNYKTNPHWLPLNTILNGKYMVGKVLGEGGFGITYIAIDLNLNMPVAIKEYYPNGFVSRDTTVLNNNVTKYQGEKLEFFEKGLDRFLTEARSVAQFFQTSGIAKVIDFFKENDTAYIVMEYVDGITLKQYLKDKGGKLDLDTVLSLMRPVITSLEEVHKSGLIHRDISPDNIMINTKGELKLLDFGAARKYEDSENKSLSIMLKPGYAPEEQYRTRGTQGPFTDVYALCATMYKMITGRTPPESLERRAEDTIVWPNAMGINIPENVENVLKKGMEILSKDRIQDMSELFAYLYKGEGIKYNAASAIPDINSAVNSAVPNPALNPPQDIYTGSSQTDIKAKGNGTRMIRIAVIVILGIISVAVTFMIKKKELDTAKYGFNDVKVQYEMNSGALDDVKEI